MSTGMEALMNKTNLIVAENLKRIRLSRGWSQAFVANQLGISQRSVSRVETGIMVSKRILKKLCSLYQVPISSIYSECEQKISKEMLVVSEEVAVGLLIKNSFIQDLEREIILRYTDNIQKEALMLRSDVERIIPEALTVKQSYSLQELITACMLINQKTLFNIRELAIA